jgi:hypothetical protein
MINEIIVDVPEAEAAIALIKSLALDVKEAQDNLFAAKVANRHRGDEVVFEVGDKVMLSTEHCRREYMQSRSG